MITSVNFMDNVDKQHQTIVLPSKFDLPKNMVWLPSRLRLTPQGGRETGPEVLRPDVQLWCEEHIGPVVIVAVKWKNHPDSRSPDHMNLRYALQFRSAADLLYFVMNFEISVNQNSDKA